MEAKSLDASAAMKRARSGVRPLISAFSVADLMLEDETSMPSEDLKREDRVMVNSPEPEYASMR